MNKLEKSKALARAMGWKADLNDISYHSDLNGQWWIVDKEGERLHGVWNDHKIDPFTKDRAFDNLCPNLYKPCNMALAWRVLNWAHHALSLEKLFDLFDYWDDRDIMEQSPEIAQALWLNKILELAIEDNIIEL